MSVTVHLPGVLREEGGFTGPLEQPPGSIRAILRALTRSYPAIAPDLVDGDGQPRTFVTAFLNGENIRYLKGWETEAGDHDELTFTLSIRPRRPGIGS